MTAAIAMVPCACGCGAMLSPEDAAREQWLSDLAGPATGTRISMAPAARTSHSAQAAEPTTTLECASCHRSFQLLTFLAEFLGRWATERPRCEDCNNRRRRPVDETARRYA